MPSKRSQDWVSVSNGLEFFLVPRGELGEVESQGYYRPETRGLTILEKAGRLYEVPIEQAAVALRSGYHDLLDRERPNQVDPRLAVADQKPQSSELRTLPALKALPSKTESPVASASSIRRAFLIDAIERSKQVTEKAQQEQEERMNAAVGWRRPWLRFRFWMGTRLDRLRTQFGATGISFAVHIAMILMLASFYLAKSDFKSPFIIVATPSLNELLVDEFTLETEPIEIQEPTEKELSDASPIQETIPEITDSVDTPDFLAAVSGQAIKLPTGNPKTAPLPGEGIGMTKGKPTIFGSKFAAINYVFVIDNSNSMTKGRFETALLQLMMTINNLTPKQRFYVIFYSDTAYGMMHPNTVPSLVPATPQNKLLLGKWLETVPLCLQTNGRKAIQAAIELKPDVIYILGDGAFTDKAAEYFSSKPTPSIVIHTLGMEVKPSDAKQFQLLATSHRGTYRDVGVMPEGAELAKKFPRPRNTVRGPVWGITLKPGK